MFKTLLDWYCSTSFYRAIFIQGWDKAPALSVTWALALIAAVWWGFSFVNPIIDLEQMHKETFSIAQIIRGSGRSSCGNGLYLLNSKNILYQFRYDLNFHEYDFFRLNIGKEITIWTQPKIDICGNYLWMGQIQAGERLVRDYALIKAENDKSRASARTLIPVAVIVAVWALLTIFFRFRRKDNTSD